MKILYTYLPSSSKLSLMVINTIRSWSSNYESDQPKYILRSTSIVVYKINVFLKVKITTQL